MIRLDGQVTKVFVSIAIVRAVVAELAAHGVSAERLFAAAELDVSLLADPAGRMPLRDMGRIVLETARLSGRPDFALRLGASPATGALHVVGHMLVSARTLRQAIALFDRYAPLVLEGARYELVERGDEAVMRYGHPQIPSGPYGRFAAELALAFMATIGAALVGPADRPRLVRFRHPRPSYAYAYAEVFRCPVVFEQSHDEIVFDAQLLDVPHVHTDEQLLALLERRAEDLLARLGAEVSIDMRVRELVALEPSLATLGLGWAAGKLGVEERTLRRQLRSEGTSWSAIFEHEQRERACAALSSTLTPIKEIAYRAGFSEPSAFHRAFKRWTGMTPAEYRREHGPSGHGASGQGG